MNRWWMSILTLAACVWLMDEGGGCWGQQSSTIVESTMTAPAQVPEGPFLTPSTNYRGGLYSYSVGLSKPRFVCFGGIDSERRESIVADTMVLNHLLAEGLPQQPSRYAMGVSIAPAGSDAALYIDGAGLILVYNVAFPVAPLAKDEADKEPEQKETVSEWDRAKKELESGKAMFWQRQSGGLVADPTGGLGAQAYVSRAGVNLVSFDPEQADKLDERVSQALQQAGNFRALDSSDSITVYVYGPSREASERTVFAWRVHVSDAGDDKLIPDSKIERKQYREQVGDQ